MKVIERANLDAHSSSAGKDTLRGELLNERRNRFFAAYMDKAKERMTIQIYQEALQQATAAIGFGTPEPSAHEDIRHQRQRLAAAEQAQRRRRLPPSARASRDPKHPPRAQLRPSPNGSLRSSRTLRRGG